MGALVGHLEAVLEVWGVILVDGLEVIEAYAFQDCWHHGGGAVRSIVREGFFQIPKVALEV